MSRPVGPAQLSSRLLMGLGAIAATLTAPAWSLTPPEPIQTEAHSCPAEPETSLPPLEANGEAAAPSNAVPAIAVPGLSNDYELFARAVQNTYAQPRYATLSTATLRSQRKGKLIKTQLRSQIVTAAPGQYRADLSFEGDNSIGNKQFLVISDGLQTWTLDHHRNQYSITTNRQRLRPFEETKIGLFALFVLSMQQIAIPELPLLASMETEKLAEQLKVVVDETTALRLNSALVDEKPHQTVTFGNAELGEVIAWVEPQSAKVKCAELTLSFQGSKVKIQEHILKRQAIPDLPESQFQFIPPEGSIEVKKPIQIGPF